MNFRIREKLQHHDDAKITYYTNFAFALVQSSQFINLRMTKKNKIK